MLYYDSYYFVQVEESEISGSGCSMRSSVFSVKRPSSELVTRFHASKEVLVPIKVKQSVWISSQSATVSLLMV